jgi:hypothetical protein
VDLPRPAPARRAVERRARRRCPRRQQPSARKSRVRVFLKAPTPTPAQSDFSPRVAPSAPEWRGVSRCPQEPRDLPPEHSSSRKTSGGERRRYLKKRVLDSATICRCFRSSISWCARHTVTRLSRSNVRRRGELGRRGEPGSRRGTRCSGRGSGSRLAVGPLVAFSASAGMRVLGGAGRSGSARLLGRRWGSVSVSSCAGTCGRLSTRSWASYNPGEPLGCRHSARDDVCNAVTPEGGTPTPEPFTALRLHHARACQPLAAFCRSRVPRIVWTLGSPAAIHSSSERRGSRTRKRMRSSAAASW